MRDGRTGQFAAKCRLRSCNLQFGSLLPQTSIFRDVEPPETPTQLPNTETLAVRVRGLDRPIK
jgi:hypothetical protein